MPSGVVCFYRDRDHSYWKNIEPDPKKPNRWKGSGRLTGVTTCAGGLDFEPDNLMRWAARVNMEGIATLIDYELGGYEDAKLADLPWLQTGDTIADHLRKEGLTYEDRREDRADQGTDVHKHAIGALAEGAMLPSYADLSEEAQGYARGVAKFWHEMEPKPLQAEQVVFDPGLGVAGRLDLRCELAGKVAIVDGKTSKYIGIAHHVQVAGYDALAQLAGFGQADELWILKVTADGDYDLIPVRATANDFVLAVNAYRTAKRIKRESNADARDRLARVP